MLTLCQAALPPCPTTSLTLDRKDSSSLGSEARPLEQVAGRALLLKCGTDLPPHPLPALTILPMTQPLSPPPQGTTPASRTQQARC